MKDSNHMPKSTLAPTITKRRRRRRLWAVGAIVAIAVASWGAYKASIARPANPMMVSDSSCQEGPPVRLETRDEGAALVTCQSWDVGTGVTGYVWHAPQPRGVVLFQHGWGDYTQRWVQQADQMIAALLEAGYTVYGFDMWGNGRSPGARTITDVNDAVEDHLAARHTIADSSDGSLPLFLVGHSLGGLVTISSALEDQRGLAGVVLLAPAIKYDVSAAELAIARIGAFLAPSASVPGMSNRDAASLLTRDPGVREQLTADDLLELRPMNFTTAATGGTRAESNWSRYGELTVPVLAVHGTADRSTDPSGSEDLVAAVSSEDATFLPVVGGYHLLLDDDNAAFVLRELQAWLSSRTPAGR